MGHAGSPAALRGLCLVDGRSKSALRDPPETFYKSWRSSKAAFSRCLMSKIRVMLLRMSSLTKNPDFITASRKPSPATAITSSGSWIVNSQDRGLLLSAPLPDKWHRLYKLMFEKVCVESIPEGKTVLSRISAVPAVIKKHHPPPGAHQG